MHAMVPRRLGRQCIEHRIPSEIGRGGGDYVQQNSTLPRVIHAGFVDRARRTPQKIALIDGANRISYGVLLEL
jgi:hypothetical protein